MNERPCLRLHQRGRSLDGTVFDRGVVLFEDIDQVFTDIRETDSVGVFRKMRALAASVA